MTIDQILIALESNHQLRRLIRNFTIDLEKTCENLRIELYEYDMYRYERGVCDYFWIVLVGNVHINGPLVVGCTGWRGLK